MMFTSNPVSKSLLDAVNNVMSEEKKDDDITKSQVKKIAKGEVEKFEKKEHEVNEDAEIIDEAGVLDTLKTGAKKVAGAVNKVIGHGSDEDLRKDLQKKMGAKPEQQHGKKSMAKYNEGVQFTFKDRLVERAMKAGEKEDREDIVHGMKKNKEYFKKKYGDRWEKVMYATATKNAMKEDLDEIQTEEHTTDTLAGRQPGGLSNDFKSFKSRLKGDGESPAPTKKPESTPAQDSIKAKGVSEEYDEAVVAELIEYMQTEEYEQLDELSKNTLASYVKKASVSANDNAERAGKHKERANAADDASYSMRKSNPKRETLRTTMKFNNKATNHFSAKSSKRLDGIDKAATRLAKEEFDVKKKVTSEDTEQLDELSKDTLSSYVKKVDDKVNTLDKKSKTYSGRRDDAGRGLYFAIRKNQAKEQHAKGVEGAKKRLASEDVEQIDEISKKTLGSYIAKSTHKGEDDRDGERTVNKGREDGVTKASYRTQGLAHKKGTDGFRKYKAESVEVVEGKDPNMDAGAGSAPDFATGENVSSSPVMNRIKSVTKSAMSRVKNEMLGKAPGNM